MVAIYEDKSNPTVRGHRVRKLVHELWNANLQEEGNVNAHLSRMFNLRTELADLQYIVNELDMREALLESLPTTTQFNQLRQTVWFASDSAAYSPEKIRELIRTAAALHEENTSGFGIGALMSVKRT